MGPDYSTTPQILRLFYATKNISVSQLTPAMLGGGADCRYRNRRNYSQAGTQIATGFFGTADWSKELEVIEERMIYSF